MSDQGTGAPSSAPGNLGPGEDAPSTATYVCVYCGPGGVGERLVVSTRVLHNARGDGRRALRNADVSTPVSHRTTVYDVAAGTPLPYCPTCGDATGWARLDGSVEDHLRRRVEVRESVFGGLGITRAEPVDPQETDLGRLLVFTDATKEVDPRETVLGWMVDGAAPGAPCDVCGYPVAVRAGHLLATQQVLVSEAYWSHMFRNAARRIDGFADPGQQERYFSAVIRTRERDRTPWLVCVDCTELFLADWTVARDHVRHGTRPRGPGRFRNRFDLGQYVLPAARAWARERGWWPSGVTAPQQPTDACDLCTKAIWEGETVSMVKPHVLEDWMRRGVLATTPDRPPRPLPEDQRGWLACTSCLGGVTARLHHATSA